MATVKKWPVGPLGRAKIEGLTPVPLTLDKLDWPDDGTT